MIEEARMMAETPDLDNIRSSPETTVQDSEFSSRKSSISQGIPCSYVLADLMIVIVLSKAKLFSICLISIQIILRKVRKEVGWQNHHQSTQ